MEVIFKKEWLFTQSSFSADFTPIYLAFFTDTRISNNIPRTFFLYFQISAIVIFKEC